MKPFNGSNQFAPPRHPVAALGNFDGVHLGHQMILKKMLAAATEHKQSAGIYTFDPHPAKILAPQSAPPLIQTAEQKLAALDKLGLAWAVLEPFNHPFSKKTPEVFFEEILLGKLKLEAIWVGYDFTFGVRRSGSIPLLKKFF